MTKHNLGGDTIIYKYVLIVNTRNPVTYITDYSLLYLSLHVRSIHSMYTDFIKI